MIWKTHSKQDIIICNLSLLLKDPDKSHHGLKSLGRSRNVCGRRVGLVSMAKYIVGCPAWNVVRGTVQIHEIVGMIGNMQYLTILNRLNMLNYHFEDTDYCLYQAVDRKKLVSMYSTYL